MAMCSQVTGVSLKFVVDRTAPAVGCFELKVQMSKMKDFWEGRCVLSPCDESAFAGRTSS